MTKQDNHDSTDAFFSERDTFRLTAHGSDEHYARHRKASAGLFLVATFSHVLACIVWSGLEFVLPVWALTGNVTGEEAAQLIHLTLISLMWCYCRCATF